MVSDLFGEVIPQAWLPDESLFSLCSRHHRLSQNHLASTTCTQLFGHRNQGSAHDLPSRVGHFSKVTNGRLGDAEAIIRSHTILPFYLPFASRVDAQGVIDAMTGASIGGLKFQLGLLTSRFRANHPLKACFDCMSEDRDRWATGYWRVQHQLPGVWVCLEHGTLLAQSSMKATGVGRFQWLLPAASHLTPTAGVLKSKDALVRLAKSSSALWAMSEAATFDPVHVANMHWQALCGRGLVKEPERRHMCHREVGAQYAAYVAPLRCIQELQALPSTPEAAAREIARLAHEPRSGHHPLRQLVMMGWLYGGLDGFVAALGEREATLCTSVPNRESNVDHASSDSRRTQLAQRVEAGASVSAASREIGIDPHTGMAWLTRDGVVTNKRPSLMKDLVRSRMIDALRRGAEKTEVAQLGRVSIESVTRLLRTEVGLREEWVSVRFARTQRHARGVWGELVAANPTAGVKAVRLLRPDIYAWLYRNDRDWLIGQSPLPCASRSIAGARVEWDVRDNDLAQKVAQVALALAREMPGRRLKLWMIYQRLPELKAKLGQLDKLPRTQRAIAAALRAQTDVDEVLR